MANFFAYSQSSIRAKPRIRQPNASHNFNAPITVAFPSTDLQPVLQPIFRRKEHPETRLPSAAASPLQEKQSHTFMHRPRCNFSVLLQSLAVLYRPHLRTASLLRRKTRADNSKGPAPERSVRTNIPQKTLFRSSKGTKATP